MCRKLYEPPSDEAKSAAEDEEGPPLDGHYVVSEVIGFREVSDGTEYRVLWEGWNGR